MNDLARNRPGPRSHLRVSGGASGVKAPDMQNAKRVATNLCVILVDHGFHPEVSYSYAGDRISRARADGRRRPKRVAKKVAQRHGYTHYVHGHSDVITVAAGRERVSLSNRGFCGYGGHLLSPGPTWPDAAYRVTGI